MATQKNTSRDEIASRAYHIWEETGRPAGRDLEHWLQAERELTSAQAIDAEPAATEPSPNAPPRSARPVPTGPGKAQRRPAIPDRKSLRGGRQQSMAA